MDRFQSCWEWSYRERLLGRAGPGESEPACHLRASLNKPAGGGCGGLCRSPGWGGDAPGGPLRPGNQPCSRCTVTPPGDNYLSYDVLLVPRRLPEHVIFVTVCCDCYCYLLYYCDCTLPRPENLSRTWQPVSLPPPGSTSGRAGNLSAPVRDSSLLKYLFIVDNWSWFPRYR